jgi:hypothetical protein
MNTRGVAPARRQKTILLCVHRGEKTYKEDATLETITFRFTPTKEDWVRATRARYRRDLRTWLSLASAGCLLLMGLCSVALYGPGFSVVFLMAMVPIALWPAFALVIAPLSAGHQVEKNERLRGETMWQVDDHRILIKNRFAETVCDWGAFGKALETEQAYLLVDAVNKQAFQVVPKRAFDSPADEAAFRELLARNIDGFD